MDVDGSDVGRHVPGLADEWYGAPQSVVRRFVAEHHPELGERARAARLPEAAPWIRRRARLVPMAPPFVDEVHEAAIVALHVQQKIAKALGPRPDERQPRDRPDVAEQDCRAR